MENKDLKILIFIISKGFTTETDFIIRKHIATQNKWVSVEPESHLWSPLNGESLMRSLNMCP